MRGNEHVCVFLIRESKNVATSPSENFHSESFADACKETGFQHGKISSIHYS